jgi:hypothetical protein
VVPLLTTSIIADEVVAYVVLGEPVVVMSLSVLLAGMYAVTTSVLPDIFDKSLYIPLEVTLLLVSFSRVTCPLVHTSTLEESANLCAVVSPPDGS